jgi:hypothetical protein
VSLLTHELNLVVLEGLVNHVVIDLQVLHSVLEALREMHDQHVVLGLSHEIIGSRVGCEESNPLTQISFPRQSSLQPEILCHFSHFLHVLFLLQEMLRGSVSSRSVLSLSLLQLHVVLQFLLDEI